MALVIIFDETWDFQRRFFWWSFLWILPWFLHTKRCGTPILFLRTWSTMWTFHIYVSLQGGYIERIFIVYRFTAYHNLIVYEVFFCCTMFLSPFSCSCIGWYRIWPSKFEWDTKAVLQGIWTEPWNPKEIGNCGYGMSIVPHIWLSSFLKHHAPCMCLIINPNPSDWSCCPEWCLALSKSWEQVGCRIFRHAWNSQQHQAWDLVVECH